MNMDKHGIVAQLSTYLPERCGIASWIRDLVHYSRKLQPELKQSIIAVNQTKRVEDYSSHVSSCFDRNHHHKYFSGLLFGRLSNLHY